MKRYVALVHFNKPGSNHGNPWTVHYRGRCIPASKVSIQCPVETIYKPEKATNPRAWLKCRGIVEISADGEVAIR